MFSVGNVEVKVKNTFINFEEAGDDFDVNGKTVWQKQVSEPTPTSSANLLMWDHDDSMQRMTSVSTSSNMSEVYTNEESLEDATKNIEDDSCKSAPLSDIDYDKWPWLRPSGDASDKKSAGSSARKAEVGEPKWGADVTTLMVRNLPGQYTRHELVKEIDVRFADKYDFIYLPIERTTGLSKGYAFINFVDARVAVDFYRSFQGTEVASKVISVTAAALQGYEANHARYAKMRCGAGRKRSQQPLFLRARDSEHGSSRKSSLTPTDPEILSPSTPPMPPPANYFGIPAAGGVLPLAASGGDGSPAGMMPMQRRAPTKRFCPHCGASVVYSSIVSFCKYCGGKLSQCQQSARNEGQRPLSTCPPSQPPAGVPFHHTAGLADGYVSMTPEWNQFMVVNMPLVMQPISGA